MKPDELREEVAIELEAMAQVIDELLALQRDVAKREPTLREKTAAAAFLAQFYNGIENILKRISLYHGVSLPGGEAWHVELFQRFSSSLYPGLPLLFDDKLASTLAPYRRFRHVAFHSYGFQLAWERMAEGVAGVQRAFDGFKSSVSKYLQEIGE